MLTVTDEEQSGSLIYHPRSQNKLPLRVMFVEFIKKNPTRCNNVSKFIIPYLYEAHYVSGDTRPIIRSPKTALAASGFSYVEGCWTCRWWTLSGTLCLTTTFHV